MVARGLGPRRRFFEIVEDETPSPRIASPGSVPREAEYRRTQKEVERLVGILEDLWSGARPVKLSKKVRAAIEDVQWGIEAAPRSTALWLSRTGSDRGRLASMRSSRWSGSPRSGSTRGSGTTPGWRSIRSVNELGQGAEDQRKASGRMYRAGAGAITNDYRVMLGRRPLLWNQRLQLAARGHSDHMSRTGILSHYEEDDPERRLPSQRARLAGYRHFQAENCSFGLPAPLEAHRAWTTSPGHHRNIVFASHTEMASSRSRAYWTQKFGRRPLDIEDELSTVQPAPGKKGRR